MATVSFLDQKKDTYCRRFCGISQVSFLDMGSYFYDHDIAGTLSLETSELFGECVVRDQTTSVIAASKRKARKVTIAPFSHDWSY
jgi:hypothetical protein